MNPETVTTWTNIIGNYGFPIFVAIALGIYIFLSQKSHRQEMKEMRDQQTQELKDIRNEHKEEIKELTKAVDQLTDFVKEFVMLVRSENNVSDKT